MKTTAATEEGRKVLDEEHPTLDSAYDKDPEHLRLQNLVIDLAILSALIRIEETLLVIEEQLTKGE